MTLERMALPLTVVAAVFGVWAFLRKPQSVVDTTNIGYQGYDPGSWTGKGLGESAQYFAHVPNYAMDPGYIASAVGNPWAQDPDVDAAVESQIATGEGSNGVPSYITYNTYGQSNPNVFTPPKEDNACGCGSCCDSKCKGDCSEGVTFTDSKGTCLLAENTIPWEPETSYVGAWYGYAALPEVVTP